jgi:hypothetical protein
MITFKCGVEDMREKLQVIVVPRTLYTFSVASISHIHTYQSSSSTAPSIQQYHPCRSPTEDSYIRYPIDRVSTLDAREAVKYAKLLIERSDGARS